MFENQMSQKLQNMDMNSSFLYILHSNILWHIQSLCFITKTNFYELPEWWS